MQSTSDSNWSRRDVLKTAGAVGLLSVAGLSGTTSARTPRYGNITRIDAFLNQPAAYKDNPIWDGTVTDMTGQATADVQVGAMTSITLPDFPPAGPFAFDPQVIRVDSGTTVRWTWVSNPYGIPIPHDVVSFKKEAGHPLFHSEHLSPLHESLTFEYTFDTPGDYLYYCTPHGAPFAVEAHGGGMVYNEFGMRGAVIVTDTVGRGTDGGAISFD